MFSGGPTADAFVARWEATITGLSAAERTLVGRGSYLINASGDCNGCHTDTNPDGFFDNGLLSGTFDVNPDRYLAGGVNLGALFGLPFQINSRNLRPHPETGLKLTEQQFIESLRFGADFRRPVGSLRVQPHFPSEFHMTLDDLKAIYAFLKRIPPIENEVTITP